MKNKTKKRTTHCWQSWPLSTAEWKSKWWQPPCQVVPRFLPRMQRPEPTTRTRRKHQKSVNSNIDKTVNNGNMSTANACQRQNLPTTTTNSLNNENMLTTKIYRQRKSAGEKNVISKSMSMKICEQRKSENIKKICQERKYVEIMKARKAANSFFFFVKSSEGW